MKALVVCKEPVFRSSLGSLLDCLNEGISVLEAASFPEARGFAAAHRGIKFLLVVMDPVDADDAARLKAFRTQYPGLRAIVLNQPPPPRAHDLPRLPLLRVEEPGFPGSPKASESPNAELTSRQREVLWLLSLGKSNKEIARTLDLAEGTVKIHCMAIYQKLNVRNRTEAALRAEQVFADREAWNAPTSPDARASA